MAYSSWSVVFGEQPSAAKWNILGTNDAYFDGLIGSGTAWTSYVPTWTNLTVTSSTVVAGYQQLGKTVRFRIKLTLAGGNAPTGSVSVSLPITSIASLGVGMPIAVCTYEDSGINYFTGVGQWATTTTITLFAHGAGGSYATANNVNATVPFTFANADAMYIQGFYEAA